MVRHHAQAWPVKWLGRRYHILYDRMYSGVVELLADGEVNDHVL